MPCVTHSLASASAELAATYLDAETPVAGGALAARALAGVDRHTHTRDGAAMHGERRAQTCQRQRPIHQAVSAWTDAGGSGGTGGAGGAGGVRTVKRGGPERNVAPHDRFALALGRRRGVPKRLQRPEHRCQQLPGHGAPACRGGFGEPLQMLTSAPPSLRSPPVSQRPTNSTVLCTRNHKRVCGLSLQVCGLLRHRPARARAFWDYDARLAGTHFDGRHTLAHAEHVLGFYVFGLACSRYLARVHACRCLLNTRLVLGDGVMALQTSYSLACLAG